jgi:hypothetical protein
MIKFFVRYCYIVDFSQNSDITAEITTTGKGKNNNNRQQRKQQQATAVTTNVQ